MKILFIGNFDEAEVHTAKWVSYFEKRHEVKRMHFDGFSMKAVAEVKKQIKEWKPDVVHSHYAGAWGLIGHMAGFHPYVVTIHGSEVLLTKGLKKWLVQWVLKKADLITTDGHHIEHKLKTEWNIPEEKMRHINFGVDVEIFKPRFQKCVDPRIALRVGTGKVYDPDTFFNAFARLLPNPKLGVLILKDLKRPEDVALVMDYSWIYISTARSDAGLSSTTAEAMACGLPVVISNVGENEKWVGWEWCFEPGNYETLANRIQFLLNDKEQRERLGIRNRTMIEKNNNFAVEMEKMDKLYKEISNG